MGTTLRSAFIEIDRTKWPQECKKDTCVDTLPWCNEVANNNKHRAWTLTTCYREIKNLYLENCCRSCCNIFTSEGLLESLTNDVELIEIVDGLSTIEESATTTIEKSGISSSASNDSGGSGADKGDNNSFNLKNWILG